VCDPGTRADVARLPAAEVPRLEVSIDDGCGARACGRDDEGDECQGGNRDLGVGESQSQSLHIQTSPRLTVTSLLDMLESLGPGERGRGPGSEPGSSRETRADPAGADGAVLGPRPLLHQVQQPGL